MRPALLEIEGFTCYREKQVIDFEKVDGPLAIAGPTGAGKSTVLDAMLFALYGKVPRVSNQVSKLVTKGVTRASIRFEFLLGEARYRVVRVVHSNTNPSSAQLERIDQDKRLADSVREVNAAIEDLLGLNHEAFLQSVILPQGQFADFLKAAPRDRRDLLANLLGLAVFGRMQKVANETATQASMAGQALRSSLANDFGDASSENLELLEQQLAALNRDIERLSADEAARRTDLNALRTKFDASVRLQQARATLEELDSAELQRQHERQRLDASRRARHVQSDWIAARGAAERAVSARVTLEAATTELQRAKLGLETASKALVAAAEPYAKVTGWRNELTELGRLEERLVALRQHEAHVVGARERLDEARRGRDKAVSELETLKATIASCDSELQACATELADVTYDAERHRVLQEQAPAARAFEDLARKLEAARGARLAAQSAREQQSRLEAEQRQKLTAAGEHLGAAEEAVTAAKERLEAAQSAHRAAALREHLHTGDECPVCLQVVTEVPTVWVPPEIDECRQLVEQAMGAAAAAKRREEAAQKAHLDARDAMLRAQAQFDAAQSTVEDLERQHDDEQQRLDDVLARWLPGTGPVSARMEVALAAFARSKERHDAITTRQGEAERNRDLAQARRDTLEGQLGDLEKALAIRTSEHENAVAALEQAAAGLTNWAESRVRAERTRLDSAITEAESAHKAAETAVAAARKDYAVAEDRLAKAIDAVARAEAEAKEATAKAEATAVERGFDSAAAAAAALLPSSEEVALDEGLREHDRRLHTAREDVAKHEPVVGDSPVDLEHVNAGEAALDKVVQALAATRTQLGGVENQVTTTRQRVERAQQLRAELSELDARERVYRALATELRSDRFPDWVLETEFRELVLHASKRLYDFTGRYTLAFEDSSFLVVDHDNAQETRSTDTLSGGETFLCSLALALELSEQILRRAGALRFDCLFIDEGFGTLDADTLDTVAEAIETLGAGHRMVGLISHVASLTERMPWRLIVSKGQGGSSVALSNDGR